MKTKGKDFWLTKSNKPTNSYMDEVTIKWREKEETSHHLHYEKASNYHLQHDEKQDRMSYYTYARTGGDSFIKLSSFSLPNSSL